MATNQELIVQGKESFPEESSLVLARAAIQLSGGRREPFLSRGIDGRGYSNDDSEGKFNLHAAKRARWLGSNKEIHPAEANDVISLEEVIARFETEYTVKQAPRFKDQITENSRVNAIEFVDDWIDERDATKTSYAKFKPYRKKMSEQDSLKQLYDFLGTAETHLNGKSARMAYLMQENLTFIGKKEFDEATEGLAEYWKYLLDSNPERELLVFSGEIAKYNGTDDMYKTEKGDYQIKSGNYVFEEILSHLTDDELEKYKDRIRTRVEDITAEKPENITAILVDDSSVSGRQMSETCKKLMQQDPRLESVLEIHQIVASPHRVRDGHAVDYYPYAQYSPDPNSHMNIPVRAYYTANMSPERSDGFRQHVALGHSTTDYGFRHILDSLNRKLKKKGIHMEPLALGQIVSPYKYDDYQLSQKERLRS